MSRDRLADAYEEQAALYARMADATAQIAHELRGVEPAGARPAVPDGVPTAPAASPAGVVPPAPAGPPSDDPIHTHCPAHGKEFKPSKNPGWGAYCTALSDDPAWANDKGYCRITSKNAGEWLRIHGAAA